MDFGLNGKCALITGGASGLGLTIARHFATLGATVRIIDLEAALQRVLDACEAVKSSGGEVLCGGERLDRPGNFITPVIAGFRLSGDK